MLRKNEKGDLHGRKLSRFVGYAYSRTPEETTMTSSATFNVLEYGAKGDGNTDDTKVSSSFSYFTYYIVILL